VQSVEIEIVGKPVIDRQATDKDAEFKVSSVPRGKELSSPSAASGVASALNSLHLDDVRAIPDGSSAAAAVATVRTFDGLSLHCTGYVDGDRHYLRIESATSSTDEAKKKEAAEIAARTNGFSSTFPRTSTALFQPIDEILKIAAQRAAGTPRSTVRL
jgi:hypothetical protein